jgi:CHAD domain-containing protein
MEREAKFELEPGARPALVVAAIERLGAAVRGCRRRRLRDVYLDTGDGWFARAGLGFRARFEDGAPAVLTVKTRGRADGWVTSRHEIEESIPADRLRLPGRLPPGSMADWARRAGRPPVLDVILEMDHRRVEYDAILPGGPRVKVCVDTVSLPAVPGRPGFKELEIELAGDRVDALADFARRLARLTGWPRSRASKIERALEQAGRPWPPDGAADEPAASAGDSFLEAGRAVLRRHFLRMLRREPGARAGLDPEQIHNMRVAVRRMRAALRVFGPAMPARRRDRYSAELRWIAAVLGRVRDADICLAAWNLDLAGLGAGPRARLAPFTVRLERRRARRHTALLQALDSARYRRLVRSLERFLLPGAPVAGAPAPAGRPVIDMAPRVLRSRMRKTRRELRRQTDHAAPQLHALRIRFKKLRYACEFFAELYGRRLDKAARRIASLQDTLGRYQDEIVMHRFLLDLRRRAVAEEDRAAADLGRLARRHAEAALRWQRRFRRAHGDAGLKRIARLVR